MQQTVAQSIGEMTSRIQAHTDLPVAVGFGISTPEQVRSVAQSAEAVVVGSAIVNEIAKHGRSAELVPAIERFVRPLVAAIKPSL